MRTKKHYEKLLSDNPNTTIGFTLAADMVYAARHNVINRAEDHQSDEWKKIARMLKRKYGEALTGGDVGSEMSPIKTAAAALGRAVSPRETSRFTGKRQ
jgi:hypothetical protein